jgi:HAD superfamily hydrolase (TIGR01509 family)
MSAFLDRPTDACLAFGVTTPLTDGGARAWLCDLDGTLYHAGGVKWWMAAELLVLGPQHIPLLRAFRHAHEALRAEQVQNPELEFAPSPFEEQLRRVLAPGQSDERTRRVVLDWMVHRPGKWLRRALRQTLVQEITSFRAAGGITAIVSDYPAQRKLEAMGLLQHFDVVVANGEHQAVRRLKPAPDGFLQAASELGVPPADCLVLGDRDDADGEAARRAGMPFRLIG